ncbi:unnamed protein product, partial [Iphiclides podalirius]
METDEDSDRPVFMPRKSLARIPPRSHEEVTKTSACTSGGLKRTLQSPEEVGTALQKPRMELRMCRPTTPRLPPPLLVRHPLAEHQFRTHRARMVRHWTRGWRKAPKWSS